MTMSVKQKQTHRHVVAKGEGSREKVEGRIRSWGLAVNGEWINSNVLLYSTRKYTQYSVINHNGEEYEKDIYIYICITKSLCYLVYFSHSVMFHSLQPPGLQHARLPCPSPAPGVAQTHVH